MEYLILYLANRLVKYYSKEQNLVRSRFILYSLLVIILSVLSKNHDIGGFGLISWHSAFFLGGVFVGDIEPHIARMGANKFVQRSVIILAIFFSVTWRFEGYGGRPFFIKGG